MQKFRQRQSDGNHMPHGNVKQRNSQADSGDEAPFLQPQFLLLLIQLCTPVHLVNIFGRKTSLLNLALNIRQLYLGGIVNNMRFVGSQIYLAADHAGHLSCHPLHRRAARSAGHSLNV